jgi:hypothetical protein
MPPSGSTSRPPPSARIPGTPSVSGEGDDHRIQAALGADPTVTERSCITRFDAEAIYRVRTAADAVDVLRLVGRLGGYVRYCRGGVTG